MTEKFLMNVFHKMGEKPSAVKVMRNRYTGEPVGYGYIYFKTEDEVKSALHKLNGKVIPNTAPVSFYLFVFKLLHTKMVNRTIKQFNALKCNSTLMKLDGSIRNKNC